jgi:hypothetical protein
MQQPWTWTWTGFSMLCEHVDQSSITISFARGIAAG